MPQARRTFDLLAYARARSGWSLIERSAPLAPMLGDWPLTPKADAIRRAAVLVREVKPSRLVIHNCNGSGRATRTYGKGARTAPA